MRTPLYIFIHFISIQISDKDFFFNSFYNLFYIIDLLILSVLFLLILDLHIHLNYF